MISPNIVEASVYCNNSEVETIKYDKEGNKVVIPPGMCDNLDDKSSDNIQKEENESKVYKKDLKYISKKDMVYLEQFININNFIEFIIFAIVSLIVYKLRKISK